MANKITCTCGHSWDKSSSSKKDATICHICGKNVMKNGGWLDRYDDGGSMQEHQENYNDSEAFASPDMQGDGFSNVGRNYSPAWGGQFELGGALPGSVGFTYARTKNIPSNGPYAKKTKASAQNGIKATSDNTRVKPSVIVPEFISRDRLTSSKEPAKAKDNRSIFSNSRAKERINDPSVDFLQGVLTDTYIDQIPYSAYGLAAKSINEGRPLTGLSELIKQPFGPQGDAAINALQENPEHIDVKTLEDKTIPYARLAANALFGNPVISEIGKQRIESGKKKGSKWYDFTAYELPTLYDAAKSHGVDNNTFTEFIEDNWRSSGGNYKKILELADKKFPKKQNGGEMSFYQNGFDWDAKTISQDGTAVKKQSRDMRTLAERKADDAKALDAKLRAQQSSLQKASSPINDERRRQLNEKYAQESGKRYNPTTGSIEDRFTPQQDRMLNKAYENIVEPMIDAEMIASAAPLVGKGVKALAKGLKNAGKEYLENRAAKNLSNELPSLPKEFYYDVNSPSGGLQQSDITDKLIKDYTHHLDEEEKLIFDLNLPEETYNSINFDEVQDIIKNKSQIVTPNKKPINYSEPLTDDQYGKWREEIYKGLSNYISPEELKELHKQSINHFKNSTVTGSGGKEHGLFIRNLIHDKIPQFNNPIIRNAKGQQIEFQPWNKLNEFPSTKGEDILNLINNSGYDVSKLSSEDWNIIDAYTHGYDNSINGALRENRTSLGTTGNFYKDQGNKLLESILKNKADKPFQVMRGVGNYDVELLHPETHLPLGIKKSRSNLSTGDIFKDDSFLSTSIPKDYSSFGQNISSELIDVPGGNIQSIAIPEASSYPQYSGEKEIILPKGLIRKVEETYPIDEVYKPYRFRTSILNPYTITGAIGGAAALQQKKQGGKITKDDNGYWNPKNWGKPVEIGSNNITMQGVQQPLIGISDEGDVQYMQPGEDYKFKGKKVVEYPVAKEGDILPPKTKADYLKEKLGAQQEALQMAQDAQSMKKKDWEAKYQSILSNQDKIKSFSGISSYDDFKSNVPTFTSRIKNYSKDLKNFEGQVAQEQALINQSQEPSSYIKNYLNQYNTIEDIRKAASTKYGYNPSQQLDPVQFVSNNMVKEANERINTNKGFPLYQDPTNEMTCINGVCSIAADQGVDFSKFPRGEGTGVRQDAQGRWIPQYNPTFSQNYEKAGYRILDPNEAPQPGDVSQYYEGQRPHHAEIVLSRDDKKINTFNNYQLTNYGKGLSTREFDPNQDGKYDVKDQSDTKYYRLTPQAAESAAMKNPEYSKLAEGKKKFESSDENKQYQESLKFIENKNANLLGEDAPLFDEIVSGARGKYAKDKPGLISSLSPRSKNPKLLEKIINQSYKNGGNVNTKKGWLEKYAEGGNVTNDESYNIQKGDTLSNISTRFNVPLATLANANQLENPNLIQAGKKLNIPTQAKKELTFNEIPTSDNKKVVIDNFSKHYDYIVEGDQVYYKTKGGKTWADISDNKTAQSNLLKFLDKNNYWAGYNSGEKELLKTGEVPKKIQSSNESQNQIDLPRLNPINTKAVADATQVRKTLANKPITKAEPTVFDDLTNYLKSEVTTLESKAKKLEKQVESTIGEVKNSVESGVNKAVQTVEDLYHTGINGIKRKIATHTGEDDDIKVNVPKINKPKTISEYYGNNTGAEISAILDVPDGSGRQFKQQVVPTSSIKFGVRNRGEYKDIKTDGLEVTTFNPFTKDKLPDNTTVLALDPSGNLHTGQYKDFKNQKDFVFSKTFRNKIVDFAQTNGKDDFIDGEKSGNPKYKQPKVKVMGDDGKIIDGSLNILVKDDSKKDYYGSIQGGRILFVNPETKEQYLVSGSMNHIKNEFKRIKGNNKYLEAYTLDNGTYSRGLSYKDKKLTPERLKSYDLENTGGGNGLYIKEYTKPVNKFKEEYVDGMPNIRTEKDESYKKGHALKNEIKNIVLHHTAYTGPNAEKEVTAQYMTPGQNTSHIVIQRNGKRSIYASPEQVTFHAGESKWNNRDNVNDFSIGVEFQGDTNKEPLTQSQIESFVEYYTPIAKKYNLSLKDVITHQMVAPVRKPDIAEKEYQRILKYMKENNLK